MIDRLKGKGSHAGLQERLVPEIRPQGEDLRCGVIKQRVARPGEGRSGGYRTLIFFRMGTRAVFAFGFAKNDRDNIGAEDERILRSTAKLTLGLSDAEIDTLVQAGKLEEVDCHD